jgi:hypothetical protein
MRIVWSDHSEILDFVLVSDNAARKLILEGCLNGQELLEEVGLTPEEAAAEVEAIQREMTHDS